MYNLPTNNETLIIQGIFNQSQQNLKEDFTSKDYAKLVDYGQTGLQTGALLAGGGLAARGLYRNPWKATKWGVRNVALPLGAEEATKYLVGKGLKAAGLEGSEDSVPEYSREAITSLAGAGAAAALGGPAWAIPGVAVGAYKTGRAIAKAAGIDSDLDFSQSVSELIGPKALEQKEKEAEAQAIEKQHQQAVSDPEYLKRRAEHAAALEKAKIDQSQKNSETTKKPIFTFEEKMKSETQIIEQLMPRDPRFTPQNPNAQLKLLGRTPTIPPISAQQSSPPSGKQLANDVISTIKSIYQGVPTLLAKPEETPKDSFENPPGSILYTGTPSRKNEEPPKEIPITTTQTGIQYGDKTYPSEQAANTAAYMKAQAALDVAARARGEMPSSAAKRGWTPETWAAADRQSAEAKAKLQTTTQSTITPQTTTDTNKSWEDMTAQERFERGEQIRAQRDVPDMEQKAKILAIQDPRARLAAMDRYRAQQTGTMVPNKRELTPTIKTTKADTALGPTVSQQEIALRPERQVKLRAEMAARKQEADEAREKRRTTLRDLQQQKWEEGQKRRLGLKENNMQNKPILSVAQTYLNMLTEQQTHKDWEIWTKEKTKTGTEAGLGTVIGAVKGVAQAVKTASDETGLSDILAQDVGAVKELGKIAIETVGADEASKVQARHKKETSNPEYLKRRQYEKELRDSARKYPEQPTRYSNPNFPNSGSTPSLKENYFNILSEKLDCLEEATKQQRAEARAKSMGFNLGSGHPRSRGAVNVAAIRPERLGPHLQSIISSGGGEKTYSSETEPTSTQETLKQAGWGEKLKPHIITLMGAAQEHKIELSKEEAVNPQSRDRKILLAKYQTGSDIHKAAHAVDQIMRDVRRA